MNLQALENIAFCSELISEACSYNNQQLRFAVWWVMEQINDALKSLWGEGRAKWKEAGRERRGQSVLSGVLERDRSKGGEGWGRGAGWVVDRLWLYLQET